MSATKSKRRCAAKSAEHRLIALPGFGLLQGSVNMKDFAVGAAAGLLGQGGVKYALERFGLIASLPQMVQRFMPLLSGVITGYALSIADKKIVKKGLFNPGAAKAHMAGAVAAGALVQAWQELQAQWPDTFNDYVYLPSMNGVLVDRPALNGVLVDTQASAANLSALNAYNLANRDEDAI